MATSILDSALAVADQGLLIFPLRPLDKRPLHASWQDEASTDPNVIIQWFHEFPRTTGYGVRTGLENNLYVVDLDGPEASAWWRGQGFPDGARVTTPSGPDRTHIYYRIEDVELPNTQGRNPNGLHPKVDTRGEGGYVVGPGSMISTGTYRGDLSNIPDIPEALVAILPEKQTYEHVDYDGPQVDSASESEQRQVSNAIERLDALPRVWEEGAGWRSTMYQVACWLSRMVNSSAYALTTEGALGIIMQHTPTDAEWGQREILEQWESARKSTDGQFADLPTESIPNLLPFVEVANLLPEFTSNGEAFMSGEGLLFGDPMDPSPRALWGLRQRILIECFRAGLSPEQAATVAWNSRAAAPLQMDMNGLAVLWGELDKAQRSVAAEAGDGSEPPADGDRPSLTEGDAKRLVLLTDEERAFVLGHEWFGSRYLTWAETRVSMMNLPYHRMNLWTILSLVFSDSGFIPKLKGPMGLNLFQMVLGKTTTGKTEALEIMRSVIKACFPKGDSPDIGGDASPNALVDRLIERDGKPSWFNADEAHGLFKEMQGVTWRTGLREKWTFLYEGRVPIVLRNGKKDISGIDATTHFVMYLMGTTAGMTEVLDEEFWTSGFLARYVFAIGAEMEATPESMLEDQQEGDVVRAYEAMPKQWAAEFASAKQKLKVHGVLPLPMLMTKEALDRHSAFRIQMSTMFVGHRQEHLIKPTIIRFANSIRKCATLVAMSAGSPKVTLEHELVALEQAEEWLTNIVTMVNKTTATGFSRSVDNVERFIASQKGREVRLERVYSHFPMKKKDSDEIIVQLIAEGRVRRIANKDLSQTLKVMEAIAA